MWNAPVVQSRQPLTYRLMESVGLGGPKWHGNSWQKGIAESGSSRLSTLMIDVLGDLVWDLPCVQQASYLEGGPLMWMLPLYLHVNQKSDYIYDNMFHANSHFKHIVEFINQAFAKNGALVFSLTGLVLYKNLGCGYSLEAASISSQKFSSLEHFMLKVSSCGRSVSIMHCAASTIAWKAYSSYNLRPVDWKIKLGRKHQGDLQNKNSWNSSNQKCKMAAILKIYFFASSPELKGQLTRNLLWNIRVTCRWKIAKIISIENPRWPPSWKSIFCYSPEPKGQLTWNLVRSIRVTCRSEIAKIIWIGNPRWPPSWKSNFCFSWTERLIDLKLGRKHRGDL